MQFNQFKNSAYITNDKISGYSLTPPFSPPKIYPEINFNYKTQNNEVYDLFRNLLIRMKLDQKNLNTSKWNPLSEIIKNGDLVCIKPNFVIDDRLLNFEQFQATVIQGAMLRPILDYVHIANPNGKIIVADGPIDLTDFELLLEKTGVKKMIGYLSKFMDIEIHDIRTELLERIVGIGNKKWDLGIWKLKQNEKYTENHDLIFNLGDKSMFNSLDQQTLSKLRSTQLARNNKNAKIFHNYEKHRYGISKLIIESDVIISLSKMKVHKKIGVSLGLKNVVGITTKRSYLPHYRTGTPMQNGDEDPDNTSAFKKIIKWLWNAPRFDGYGRILFRKTGAKPEIRGSWYGNDTIWRSTIDLNRILIYGSKNGKIKTKPQRKYISIIDGIIGGEGDGPLAPSPVKSNTIVFGSEPVEVDFIGTCLMGIDPMKLRIMKELVPSNELRIHDKTITQEYLNSLKDQIKPVNHFNPPNTWKGFIELENTKIN